MAGPGTQPGARAVLLDPVAGAEAEARHLRLLVHDAIERTELAPISLKEEVNEAFSVIRTAINAAVTVEHLREGCLEAGQSLAF